MRSLLPCGVPESIIIMSISIVAIITCIMTISITFLIYELDPPSAAAAAAARPATAGAVPPLARAPALAAATSEIGTPGPS